MEKMLTAKQVKMMFDATDKANLERGEVTSMQPQDLRGVSKANVLRDLKVRHFEILNERRELEMKDREITHQAVMEIIKLQEWELLTVNWSRFRVL